MSESHESQTTPEKLYQVVVNHEEQYAIWPVGHALPLGWRAGEVRGTREECLAYVQKVWTDMRPLSIRQSTRDSQRGEVAQSPARNPQEGLAGAQSDPR